MKILEKLDHFKRLAGAYLEFRAGRTTLTHPPLHVYLEITSACNLRCRMCPVGHSRDTLRKPSFMTREMVAKVLAEARGKVREFSLHVLGEPLLHPEFDAIVRDMHDAGFRVRLYTNAMLLTEAVAKRVLDARVDAINFSVDGYTAEEYAGIRVGGDFETVLGNVERFMRMRRERAAKAPHAVFQIIELDTPQAPDRATREAHLARVRSLGCDLLRIIEPNCLAGFGDGVFTKRRPRGARYFHCNQLWGSMAILANGDYASCCVDTVPNVRLGNVERDALMDVWNGKALRALRAKLAAGDLAGLPLCQTCSEPWQPTFQGIPLNKFRETAKRLFSL